MTNDEIRAAITHMLRTMQVNRQALGRPGSQVHTVIELLKRSAGRGYLSENEEAYALDVLWEFLLLGVIRPGHTEAQADLPLFAVTEYGKSWLNQADFIDTSNEQAYIGALRARVPNVDAVIVDHVGESVKTFRVKCYKASTVMLGCAAEFALEQLIEAYIVAIQDPTRQANARGAFKRPTILQKFEEYRKRLQGHRGNIAPDIANDLDVWLEAIFNAVRLYRNDAGHPKAVQIEREVAEGNLHVFIPYCAKLYQLMAWYQANPV